MRAFSTDHFELPLPAQHRFPMAKYRLLRERVGAELPEVRLLVPPAATDVELTRVHSADYVRRVSEGALTAVEVRRMGFPWSPALVERSRRSVGATIAASRAALEDGVAVNLAGGTHHAGVDRGEGFCVFNDVAVAVRAVQAESPGVRVMVIDCDVHQGNGTAAIFRDDATVLLVDLYGARNFPFVKEAVGLQVPLPDDTDDATYLAVLDETLSRAFAVFAPELAVYVSGADPFEGDALGRLALSKRGLARRDALVLARCAGRGVPVAVTMAGGYASALEDIVEIHLSTVRAALAAMRTRTAPA